MKIKVTITDLEMWTENNCVCKIYLHEGVWVWHVSKKGAWQRGLGNSRNDAYQQAKQAIETL